MDIKLRYKEGKAMAVTEAGEARIIKLVLKDEFLEILEKLNPSKLDNVSKIQQIVSNKKMATESSFSYSKLPIERTVDIMMEDSNLSLGISVKGGTDFNLPILISKIIPGERADKTKRLFVGDAILELNGKSMLSCTHKDAVDSLLSAGAHVVLQVRHLPHAATVLLNEGVFKRQPRTSEEREETPSKGPPDKETVVKAPDIDEVGHNNTSNGDHHGEGSSENIHVLPSEEYSYLVKNSMTRKTKGDSKNWVIGLRISLQYAYLSVFEYQRSPHWEKLNSFLVRSIEGHSTGIISFKDPSQFHYWKEAIKFNMSSLLINNIKRYNQSSSKDNQVHYMGWLFFIQETNGSTMKNCKSYHECEYANIDTIGVKEVQDTVMKNGKIQCIPGKHISVEESPPVKWCYMSGSTSQKNCVSTPVRLKSSQQCAKGHSEAHHNQPSRPPTRHHNNCRQSIIDKPLFIILRGIYVFIFAKPPYCSRRWSQIGLVL